MCPFSITQIDGIVFIYETASSIHNFVTLCVGNIP